MALRDEQHSQHLFNKVVIQDVDDRFEFSNLHCFPIDNSELLFESSKFTH